MQSPSLITPSVLCHLRSVYSKHTDSFPHNLNHNKIILGFLSFFIIFPIRMQASWNQRHFFFLQTQILFPVLEESWELNMHFLSKCKNKWINQPPTQVGNSQVRIIQLPKTVAFNLFYMTHSKIYLLHWHNLLLCFNDFNELYLTEIWEIWDLF